MLDAGRWAPCRVDDDVRVGIGDQRLGVVRDERGTGFDRVVRGPGVGLARLPADRRRCAVRALGVEIGDRHDMHPRGVPRLGQIHGAEFPRAD